MLRLIIIVKQEGHPRQTSYFQTVKTFPTYIRHRLEWKTPQIAHGRAQHSLTRHLSEGAVAVIFRIPFDAKINKEIWTGYTLWLMVGFRGKITFKQMKKQHLHRIRNNLHQLQTTREIRVPLLWARKVEYLCHKRPPRTITDHNLLQRKQWW